MKCIVIYFSQTGNTEKVARAIQAGVKQGAGNCELVKIKEANPRRLFEYDLIGLGSPAFGAAPDNVKNFINNMRFVGGKHIFVFCTHGSGPEPFFPSLYPRLKSRGMTVIGMGDWYGDCHLLHSAQPYPTAGHPDEIDLEEAEEFGREMVVRSWRISAGETGLIPAEPAAFGSPSRGLQDAPELQMPAKQTGAIPSFPGPAAFAPPSGELPRSPNPPQTPGQQFSLMRSFSKQLKFYKKKCLYPECRLCMDNCPMDGIDLSVDPPVIAQPCEECEFCAKICPTGALDMTEWVEAMVAGGIKSFPIFMLNNLKKAEAEGRFRRLEQGKNPDEYYSNPDNFGFKKNKNHPQWIIGKGAP